VLTGPSAPHAAAHDRVHRLGQTCDVEVTRFVVSDSIEERILEVSNTLLPFVMKREVSGIMEGRALVDVMPPIVHQCVKSFC
jgi:hypothetical protein